MYVVKKKTRGTCKIGVLPLFQIATAVNCRCSWYYVVEVAL